MTREDEIRERWAKATSGPWERVEFLSHVGVDSVSNPQQVIASVRHEDDIAAIAAAPSDIAYLLAEVERLRDALDVAGDIQTALVELATMARAREGECREEAHALAEMLEAGAAMAYAARADVWGFVRRWIDERE